MPISHRSSAPYISVVAAFVLLAPVFSPIFFSMQRFWFAMPLAVAGLNAVAWWQDHDVGTRLVADLRVRPLLKIVGGLLTAALLYVVFVLGRIVVTRIVPWGASDLAAIYDLRADQSRWLLAGLLVWIGAGEELFWRHHLQHELRLRCGPLMALTGQAALYASVHIASANLTLVAAALVAGAFWGMTYALWRSPWLNIVSHATWDIAIFLVVPLG